MSGSRLTRLVDREVDRREDLTAGELFHRLRDSEDATSAESDEVYRELVDEPPDELVRNTRERDADRAVDDDVLADDEAVESLLLPDRTEADEFQWIDTASDLEDSEADEIDDGGEPENPDEIVDVQDWDVSFESDHEEPAPDDGSDDTRSPQASSDTPDDGRDPDVDRAATDEQIPGRVPEYDFDPSVLEPQPRSAHPRAVTGQREELPPIVDEDPENIAVPVLKEDDPSPPAADREPAPDGVLGRLKRLFRRLF